MLRNKVVFFIFMLFLIGILTSCSLINTQNNLYYNNKRLFKEKDNYTFKNCINNSNLKDKKNLRYSGFSGDYTIWTLILKENEEITFNYDSRVNSGNFKAVLVGSNKEVENIFEGSDEGTKKIILAKGEYRVDIVGRNAEGELKLSNDANKNIEIIDGN